MGNYWCEFISADGGVADPSQEGRRRQVAKLRLKAPRS